MNRKDNLGIRGLMKETILTEEDFLNHLREPAKKFYTLIQDKIVHVDTWIKPDNEEHVLDEWTMWRIQFRIKKEDFGILAERFNDWNDSTGYSCNYNKNEGTITVTTYEMYV